MHKKKDFSSFITENAIIRALVFTKVLIHLIHPEYGYFRDELFYIAISDQFSFDNLDLLPLTPLYLKLITSLFGHSLKALHFASGLCGAAALLLACLMARDLGGKKYAILMTGLLMLFSGFLSFGAIFTYDSLDFLIQVFVLYLMLKMVQEYRPKLWLGVGLLLGLGLLNKLTILFFGAGIFASLWFVKERRYLKSKWIWISALIASLCSLPFVLWQFSNNWYFLSVAGDYSGGIAYVPSFFEFLWQQILPNNPFSFPIWIGALGLLLFSPQWKTYRLFGIMYVLLYLMYFLVGAKFYFLVPMYAILFAVGSVWIEKYLNQNVFWLSKKTLKIGTPILYAFLGTPLLPMVIPILPVEQLVKFVSIVGIDAGVQTENHKMEKLPQHIADRFGWEEMVEQVADVYQNVNSGLDDLGIITGNWGQAGAIHLFGKKYNLPEPISLHGWYYYETLRTHEFLDNYISVGVSEGHLNNIFDQVLPMGIFTHPYCVPYENNKAIFLCRGPRFNLRDYWLVDQNMDPVFLEILNGSGVQAAIDYFYEMKLRDSSILFFTERQINALGYKYLFEGNAKDAIELFKLNVVVYPESSNVYDSLGEGYLVDGQYALAIINYAISLEKDPGNENAKDKLAELKTL
mgnify:CR=1 FL=1